MEDFIQLVKILDDEQLNFVNDYIDGLHFVKNTIFGDQSKVSTDDSFRSSTGSSMAENHPATLIVHNAINGGLLTYRDNLNKADIICDSYPVPGGYNTSSHRESIQVLEYTKDQKYKWHFDACTDPKSSFYHRQVSVVLYLSDDFEGGSTEFKLSSNCKFKPPAGYALFFPSNWCFPHCSTPVLSGKKRVAVTWYYCTDNNL